MFDVRHIRMDEMADEVIVVGSSVAFKQLTTRSKARDGRPGTASIAGKTIKTSKKTAEHASGANSKESRKNGSEEILQKLCRMLMTTHDEIKTLNNVIKEQQDQIREFKATQAQIIQELKHVIREQQNEIRDISQHILILKMDS